MGVTVFYKVVLVFSLLFLAFTAMLYNSQEPNFVFITLLIILPICTAFGLASYEAFKETSYGNEETHRSNRASIVPSLGMKMMRHRIWSLSTDFRR